jgi:chromosome segregation ATPase
MSVLTVALKQAEAELADQEKAAVTLQRRIQTKHADIAEARGKLDRVQSARVALQERAANGEQVHSELASLREQARGHEDLLEDHQAVHEVMQRQANEAGQELERARRRTHAARAAVIREQAIPVRDRLNAAFRQAELEWATLSRMLLEASQLDHVHPDWLERARLEITIDQMTFYGAPPTLRLPVVGTLREL